MDDPAFLRVEDVEKLHAMALERFGGSEGLRDRNAFESAVHQPKKVFYYGGGDLFDMAAAYCCHIAQAQAFLDGNKRTAAAAVIVFFEANGRPLTGDSMRLHGALIDVADQKLDRDGLAETLRERPRRNTLPERPKDAGIRLHWLLVYRTSETEVRLFLKSNCGKGNHPALR